jgi:hypothetical protein
MIKVEENLVKILGKENLKILIINNFTNVKKNKQ